MRLSQNHELALYAAMLLVLRDTCRGHSKETDDLFALYDAVNDRPAKAIERLEAIAQDDARHASVRSTAGMVAGWERNQAANAKGDG